MVTCLCLRVPGRWLSAAAFAGAILLPFAQPANAEAQRVVGYPGYVSYGAPVAVAAPVVVPVRPVVYPQRVYPGSGYRYAPYTGRLCTRTERRWVPWRVTYDRYGNVERVRGRYVSTRIRVPC